MKKTALIIALAASTFSTAAVARDGAAYVELAGGITAPNDSDFDSEIDPDIAGTIEWDSGLDASGILGYDFGRFRAEAEVAYKSHSFDKLVSPEGDDIIEESDEVDLDLSTWSVMANALVDLGPDDGFNGFVGGGIGIAGSELDQRDFRDGDDFALSESDTTFAWQLLAGVRVPVSENIDVGLKYRYFNQDGLQFIVSDNDDLNTDFTSHSLLLTLTYNVGG